MNTSFGADNIASRVNSVANGRRKQAPPGLESKKQNGTDDMDKKFIDYRWEHCGLSTSCGHFRQLLSTWPDGKPKAAIYILIGGGKQFLLTRMLESLYTMFNDMFKYPVIAFHEHGFDPSPYTGRYKWLFFVQISFISPRFVPETRHGTRYHKGYFHMCRFHAWMVYTHPIMEDLEYAWRLDCDSRLIGPPLTYDLFKFMKDNNLVYGFRALNLDVSDYVTDLWESALAFANDNHINGTFFYCWRHRRVFYNNFEISKQSFWRSKAYRDYFSYLDELGNIFRYRWGDAAMKGIAVSLFAPIDKVHKFEDVGYAHGRWLKSTGFYVEKPTLRPLANFLPCLNGTYRVRHNKRFPIYILQGEKVRG